MTQATPPGDLPLYEGLGVEWNDIVGAFPEEKRAELAPILKSRIDAYEPLKQWENFQKSGITPEYAGTALDVFKLIEDNPREIYNTIGKYLGVTPQEAKEVVEAIEDDNGDDPRIKSMQEQIETLGQIALAQRNQTTAEKQAAQEEALLEKELSALKKKYGDDVDEEEVIMRMYNKNLTAEQAHLEYSAKVTALRARRPAPMLMGGGGAVPRKDIDVTKLNSADTKNLVTQMLENAKAVQ